MYFLLSLPSLPQRRLVDQLTKQWFVVRQFSLACLAPACRPPIIPSVPPRPPPARPGSHGLPRKVQEGRAEKNHSHLQRCMWQRCST